MFNIWTLLIAAGLGFLGSGTMVLLQMYSGKIDLTKKGKLIAFIILGGIAAFVSALAGDGAALVGPIGYFAIGALGPGILEEVIAGYQKRKEANGT